MKFMEIKTDNSRVIKNIDAMLNNPHLNKKMREQLETKKDILLNNKTITK
jgi:hypothetical protein